MSMIFNDLKENEDDFCFGGYMNALPIQKKNTDIEELKAYRAIGTVSEFRELKEKATGKKAEWIFDDFSAKFGNPYRCSNCDEEFGDTHNYCPNCGCDMYAD